MERTIKFRAWHLQDKEFVTSEYLDNAEWGYLRNAKHLALMQYTGLKDKNGKEIYEGDVLTSAHPDYTPGYKWIVEWRGAGFYPFNDDDEKSHGDFDTMEVIGDIYSTPELLREER